MYIGKIFKKASNKILGEYKPTEKERGYIEAVRYCISLDETMITSAYDLGTVYIENADLEVRILLAYQKVDIKISNNIGYHRDVHEDVSEILIAESISVLNGRIKKAENESDTAEIANIKSILTRSGNIKCNDLLDSENDAIASLASVIPGLLA